MSGLQDYYGKIGGEKKYIEMREEKSIPFLKGLKTARDHGHLKEYVPKYVGWKSRKK